MGLERFRLIAGVHPLTSGSLFTLPLKGDSRALSGLSDWDGLTHTLTLAERGLCDKPTLGCIIIIAKILSASLQRCLLPVGQSFS